MTTGPSQTEIIAFSSGKGGTGKTLIAACLGYALTRSGHRTLMIDADPGTDGLSLFLLGPKGMHQIEQFQPQNTFVGLLRSYANGSLLPYESRAINRSGPNDHGVIYEALISGKSLYGDVLTGQDALAVPDLDQHTLRTAVDKLFSELRRDGRYDYVLVDTRGGFAVESTDICALADSFLVVTEPDYTSFYQDRNLVKRISIAAQELGRRPLLRSTFVNKATEGCQPGENGEIDLGRIEQSFRLELTREFPLKYEDTHAIPLDLDAVKSYKTQRMPFVAAPASMFSFATLSAFGDLLRIVTAAWPRERIDQWNVLIESVSRAIAARNEENRIALELQATKAKELATLNADNEKLRGELARYQRENMRLEELYRGQAEATRLFLEKVPAQVAIPKEQRGDQVPATGDRALPSAQPSAPIGSTSREASQVAVAKSRRLLFTFIGLLIFVVFSITGVWLILARKGPTAPAPPSNVDTLTKLYQPDLPPTLSLQYFNQARSTGVSNFANVNLSGLDLDGMDLSGLSFRNAHLNGVSLRGTKLAKTDFSGASLIRADFTNATMPGAILFGANLDGARIQEAQINQAETDRSTILPPSASRPR
jgi:cellulose biosynthesis protein BcsQ